MFNIKDLISKAASNNVTIKLQDNGLYQLSATSMDHIFGNDHSLDDLKGLDDNGMFDEFTGYQDDSEFMTDYLCTNGSNSSFTVQAVNADIALLIAVKRFDSDSDYVLPISVASEDGETGACISEPIDEVVYSDDELGINDDF